jgi:ACT domain-containing protein
MSVDINRENVRSIVESVLEQYECGGCALPESPAPVAAAPAAAASAAARAGAPASDPEAGFGRRGHRVIITVLGRNAPGIAAGVTGVIAEFGGNILDMSQTLLGEYFAMVVVADLSDATMDYGMIQELLTNRGVDLGVRIVAQHEDVFRYMHRI